MFRRPRPDPEVVHSITALPTSVRDDQRERMRAYVLTMTLRTVCFIGAGLCGMAGWTVAAIVCAVGAVVLPYPAVVLANNAGNRKSHFMVPATPVREIGTAEDHAFEHEPRRPPDPGPASEPQVTPRSSSSAWWAG